jgi:hypothetical protein
MLILRNPIVIIGGLNLRRVARRLYLPRLCESMLIIPAESLLHKSGCSDMHVDVVKRKPKRGVIVH